MLVTIAIAAVSFAGGAFVAFVYSGWREIDGRQVEQADRLLVHHGDSYGYIGECSSEVANLVAHMRGQLTIAQNERAGAERLHADLTDKHNALLARIDKALALEPPVGGNGTARRMAKMLRGEA